MPSRNFKNAFLRAVITGDPDDDEEGDASADVGVVTVLKGGDSRWHRHMTSIFGFEGKHYGVEWRSTLTENGEDELPEGDGETACREYAEAEVLQRVWRRVE
jgi:hypothetical protein